MAATLKARPNTSSKWTGSLSYKLRNSHDIRRDNLMKLFNKYKFNVPPSHQSLNPQYKVYSQPSNFGSISFVNKGVHSASNANPPTEQVGNNFYFMDRIESLDEPILEENQENNHESTDGQPPCNPY